MGGDRPEPQAVFGEEPDGAGVAGRLGDGLDDGAKKGLVIGRRFCERAGSRGERAQAIRRPPALGRVLEVHR